MVLCQGEPPRRFVAVDLHFIFDLNFVVVLHLSTFFIHICFRHHPSLVRGLSWSFYTNFILSAQPIAERFATLSFSTIPLSSYRERYSFGWTFFTLCSFTDILPAFINASLGASSSSLKFAGLHTDDPRNKDLAHLFVWFTVIQSLYSERFSFKFYQILSWIACGESLIYLPLNRFELISLVQSHM